MRIYDAKSHYNPVSGISGFSKGIYSVDFANNSLKFAFAGGDSKICIYDMDWIINKN